MSDPGQQINPEGYKAYLKAQQLMAQPIQGAAPPPTSEAPPPAAAAETAPPGVVPAEQPGILSQIATGAKNLVMHPIDTLKGVAGGLSRVTGETAGQAMDLAKDFYDVTGVNAAQKNFGEWLLKGPERFPGQKNIAAGLLADPMLNDKGTFADALSSREYLGKIGNNSVNQGVATIGSLILGTVGLNEAKVFQWAPKIVKGGLEFGTAAFALQDPNSVRLTSALNGLGVHSEFTDWLGADGDKAGPFENRFKNALEGVVLGVAGDAVFQGAKYLRSVIKGEPDVVAKAAAEAAAKEMIPAIAHPGEVAVGAVSKGAATEIKVGSETITTIPTANFQHLLDEARLPPAAASEGLSLGETTLKAADPGPLPGLDNEAVAPLLRSMAIKLHDTPHVVRTDAERNALALSAAQEVGVDPTEMLAYASHVGGRVADIDVSVTATQMLWRKVATDLDGLASKGLPEGAAEADIAAHKAAINNAVSFSGSFQDIRSGLGRGLRSTTMLQKATDYVGSKLGDDFAGGLFKEHNPVPPQPNTIQEINDFYSIWNDLKTDAAAKQNFLRGIQTLPSQWLYLRTSFANNFTANALAGLPSIGMNVVGPTVIGALHTLEKTTGGFMGALNPLLTASERAASLSVATNASRAYVQTIGDIPEAFRWAVQASKENRSLIGGGNTVDVGRMGPVTDSMLRASKMSDGPTLGYQLGNLINFWPRNFQRVNAGLDEFAKRLSYMGETRLNAAVEYDTKGAAALGDMDRAAFIKSAMENSIDEVGAATNEVALRSAERTTFTGSLSGNDYHPLVGKASEFVQAMRSQFPETRYVIPVFNVPANSLGETIRRVPALNLALGETRDELLGHLGPVRQADAYGRTMLGAAFMLWAYHASRQGQLTGAGPTDATNRKAWSDQGYQPYSIRVGDKWVDYSRYDLPGALLGIPANMYDSTVYHRQDDPSWGNRMIGGAGALAQYFKDKAALQGASNLMNFGGSPGADETFVNRTLNSIVSRSLVPNFVTQLGRNTSDDIKRSATSPAEALMNALPMTSKGLDPIRNVLGEPLHVPRDSLIENMLPITIAPATTFKSDPVMSELDRLRQATGSASGVTHHSTFDGNYYDSTQVTLEDGHSMYDHLIAARQTVRNPEDGSNLRDALTKLFQMPEYKNAKDADASNLTDSEGNVSRGAVVAKVFATYNKAAIQQVAKDSAIAKKMLAITAAKKIDDARLRPYSASDLASNPTLLKSLGIDISKYEQKVSGQ